MLSKKLFNLRSADSSCVVDGNGSYIFKNNIATLNGCYAINITDT